MKTGRKRLYLPDDDELLRRLFVDEQISGIQIAKMFNAPSVSEVYKILRRLGINTGADRSRICKVRGCGKPSRKIWHSVNKCWYGRLCEEHRKKQYSKYSRETQRRNKAITPDRFKPWQRRDQENLTDYEKERLWIIKSKKKLKELTRLLKPNR